MLNLTSVGAAMARLFLFPGDLVCTALGLERDDKRELIRMLVNSLVWIVAGMLVVAAVA
ncbi:MAG TPA: hypothetical protein VFC54_12215 [Pseudolabrys sp.]|nr:hypothetical protein [Pseudolabrys sp.]